MYDLELAFRGDKDSVGIQRDGGFELRESSVAGLEHTPQLILLESLVLFLARDDLVLQADLRVLIDRVYFMRG